MAFDDPWEYVALLGVILFNVSLVPQLIRTLQLRRAEDVSALFTITVLAASAVMMVYMYQERLWVAASGYWGNLVVWSIVLYYRLNPKAPRSAEAEPGHQPND